MDGLVLCLLLQKSGLSRACRRRAGIDSPYCLGQGGFAQGCLVLPGQGPWSQGADGNPPGQMWGAGSEDDPGGEGGV